MKNYLASSFIFKITANGECALSALEVPRPFFAHGVHFGVRGCIYVFSGWVKRPGALFRRAWKVRMSAP